VKLEAGSFVGGTDIEISLEYRTHLANGLLLFAFGGTGTYFILQLDAGTLLWELSVNEDEYAFRFPNGSISLCDGQWHVVKLVRKGTQMQMTVDSMSLVYGGDSQHTDSVAITSYLYVGGIPDDDPEAVEFIRRNQLDQQIQQSQ